MATLNINGINIYYESYGEGIPVVLTYGLGGSTRQWTPQIEAFSERYRLILWDTRGHGQSDSPRNSDEYGMEISASDLMELLASLSISYAYIGGLSMGGGVATRFALTYPSIVKGLLLMDSAAAVGHRMSETGRAMREATIELALTKGMAAVAEFSLRNNPNIIGRASRGSHAVDQVRAMYESLDPVGYAHSVRALIDPSPLSKPLSEINAPTLAIAGEQDPSLHAMRRLHQKISTSKLVVIPEAGHLSNWDQPDKFNQEVLAFLAETDSGRIPGNNDS